MSLVETNNGKIMLGDTVYAVGKKLVQVFIPAISTAYFALANIWGLPSPEKVMGTLAVVATFIGVTLHISSTQFDASGVAYSGTVHTVDTEDGTRVGLSLDDPAALLNKKAVTLLVAPAPPESLPKA